MEGLLADEDPFAILDVQDSSEEVERGFWQMANMDIWEDVMASEGRGDASSVPRHELQGHGERAPYRPTRVLQGRFKRTSPETDWEFHETDAAGKLRQVWVKAESDLHRTDRVARTRPKVRQGTADLDRAAQREFDKKERYKRKWIPKPTFKQHRSRELGLKRKFY